MTEPNAHLQTEASVSVPETGSGTAPGTGSGASEDDETFSLVAYDVSRPHVDITAAPLRREWMDATDDRFANRCLPMLIANQAGWWLLNPETFVARWDGGESRSALRIEYEGVGRLHMAVSHFGSGVLTWRVPVLLRTPPGWNLLVRGPANMPKDGACPLEGVVETDWAVATFTMNWKLTRPDAEVEFRAGEPFAMLVPQRRGELERFRPTRAQLGDWPERDLFRAWAESRSEFLVRPHLRGVEQDPAQWQRDYMIGAAPGRAQFPDHQRRLRLSEFEDQAPAAVAEPSRPRAGRPPEPPRA